VLARLCHASDLITLGFRQVQEFDPDPEHGTILQRFAVDHDTRAPDILVSPAIPRDGQPEFHQLKFLNLAGRVKLQAQRTNPETLRLLDRILPEHQNTRRFLPACWAG
jgi:hypothetical protein